MKLNELEKLVRKGESEVLEFKTSTANLKSALETICAFLNAKGGTVFIGINNNGRITGQSVTDQTNLEISNLISKLEPPAHIDVEYILLESFKFSGQFHVKTNR